jgi:Cys-rich protein (TIGR01571 family)
MLVAQPQEVIFGGLPDRLYIPLPRTSSTSPTRFLRQRIVCTACGYLLLNFTADPLRSERKAFFFELAHSIASHLTTNIPIQSTHISQRPQICLRSGTTAPHHAAAQLGPVCTPFGPSLCPIKLTHTGCLSWWCPCIIYGRTRHRIRSNGDMNGYSCCNGSVSSHSTRHIPPRLISFPRSLLLRPTNTPQCAAFCGLSCIGVPFVLPMINRGDMRAKYGLKGSELGDCGRAFCCGPCDLSQQDKEAEYRESEKMLSVQQPGAHAGMNYKPQQQV